MSQPPDFLMQFFTFDHLPPHLQTTSKMFAELAAHIATLPSNPERTTALRKLVESKDCAVRAVIAGAPAKAVNTPPAIATHINGMRFVGADTMTGAELAELAGFIGYKDPVLTVEIRSADPKFAPMTLKLLHDHTVTFSEGAIVTVNVKARISIKINGCGFYIYKAAMSYSELVEIAKRDVRACEGNLGDDPTVTVEFADRVTYVQPGQKVVLKEGSLVRVTRRDCTSPDYTVEPGDECANEWPDDPS